MPREEPDLDSSKVLVVVGPPGSVCFPYHLQGGVPGNFFVYLGFLLKCSEEAMAQVPKPVTASARRDGTFEWRSSPPAQGALQLLVPQRKLFSWDWDGETESCEAAETAQLVKHLSYKHEDLNIIPRTPNENR